VDDHALPIPRHQVLHLQYHRYTRQKINRQSRQGRDKNAMAGVNNLGNITDVLKPP
jgi:hypothetical protein